MSAAPWRWDPWFVQLDDGLHLFQLEADPGPDPGERHHRSRIAHLVHRGHGWQELGAALGPGGSGSWDDLALWTGSAVVAGESLELFYTGRSRAGGWAQRIGRAAARLGEGPLVFERRKAAVLEARGPDYLTSDSCDELGFPPAWRDPFVFGSPGDWQMLLSARSSAHPAPYNACIAHFRSDDLEIWRPAGTLLCPGLFAEMEVPQLRERDGWLYLIFSSHRAAIAPAQDGQVDGGLHCWSSRDVGGPWSPAAGEHGLIAGLEEDRLYGAQLVDDPAEGLVAVGFHERDGTGAFECGLSGAHRLELADGRARRVGPARAGWPG